MKIKQSISTLQEHKRDTKGQNIRMNKYGFERMKEFTYLGTIDKRQ